MIPVAFWRKRIQCLGVPILIFMISELIFFKMLPYRMRKENNICTWSVYVNKYVHVFLFSAQSKS